MISNIKQWYKLNFKKDSILKCIIMTKAGKIRREIIDLSKVKENEIKIKDKVYYFNQDDIVIDKGVSTLFFLDNHSKPYDFDNATTPEITAKEFNTALNNNVVKELMESTQESDFEDLQVILTGACLIGILVVGYFTFNVMEGLDDLVRLLGENEDLLKDIIQYVR